MLDNYSKSYGKGAVEFDSENAFPKFEAGELGPGEVSLDDYQEAKYFSAFKK